MVTAIAMAAEQDGKQVQQLTQVRRRRCVKVIVMNPPCSLRVDNH
jgi:hypothetical protein